ncbi:MAG TPA: DUF4215 domain-containing protein [Candidatus Dormibacteraeota bacterium]|nr:DUF4215 domain-containing protein [Candidatus Dormibacteraeota bacterium]
MGRDPSGTIEAGEECDDGNIIDGDGCDHTCAVERCWSCSGAPSVCAPVSTPCDPNCQNGVLDPGEECDDGNAIDGDGCDHACAVETCWQFDSFVGLSFPLPSGTSCDAQDGIACTINGMCDGAGHCIETPTASLCDDDGDPCTGEVCDPMTGCMHTPDVRLDCRPASSSTLQLKNRSGDPTSSSGRGRAVSPPPRWTLPIRK